MPSWHRSTVETIANRNRVETGIRAVAHAVCGGMETAPLSAERLNPGNWLWQWRLAGAVILADSPRISPQSPRPARGHHDGWKCARNGIAQRLQALFS